MTLKEDAFNSDTFASASTPTHENSSPDIQDLSFTTTTSEMPSDISASSKQSNTLPHAARDTNSHITNPLDSQTRTISETLHKSDTIDHAACTVSDTTDNLPTRSSELCTRSVIFPPIEQVSPPLINKQKHETLIKLLEKPLCNVPINAKQTLLHSTLKSPMHTPINPTYTDSRKIRKNVLSLYICKMYP